jgi:flagellar motility protein MotE (MotC chaperone)
MNPFPLPEARFALRAIAALSLAGLLSGGAAANEPSAPVTTERAEATPEAAADASEVERFCSNIADAARDQRYALQTQQLTALQAEVDKRIKALEDKRAEYEAWLKRRDDFLVQAQANVVKIYAVMKPDAAAERLAAMRVELAAAILMKLDPRKAGVILNEMETKQAAMLTGVMAAAARKVDPT